MLFYFTATGNCLYVAKQFEENPLSIAQELKKDELHYKDESIGIVTPVYGGELPKIVRRFLQKATFDTEYLYMIPTYGKNDSVAAEWAYYFGKAINLNFDYINTLMMVDNYLPSFDMNEEKAINKEIPEQLSLIKEDIFARKQFIKHPDQAHRDLYEMASRRPVETLNGSGILIDANKCRGCGMCALVCPVGNFYIQDGIAQRHSNTCEFCLACAHHCASKAISTKVDKNPDARFINENIKISEIIQANRQS